MTCKKCSFKRTYVVETIRDGIANYEIKQITGYLKINEIYSYLSGDEICLTGEYRDILKDQIYNIRRYNQFHESPLEYSYDPIQGYRRVIDENKDIFEEDIDYQDDEAGPDIAKDFRDNKELWLGLYQKLSYNSISQPDILEHKLKGSVSYKDFKKASEIFMKVLNKFEYQPTKLENKGMLFLLTGKDNYKIIQKISLEEEK